MTNSQEETSSQSQPTLRYVDIGLSRLTAVTINMSKGLKATMGLWGKRNGKLKVHEQKSK